MKVLPTFTTIGSHSALDICTGAKKLGFSTLVVTQVGREDVYTKHFSTQGNLGCVDQTISLSTFKEILKPVIQKRLQSTNALFIPNRSFEVYINDYDAIEQEFNIPIFGNRFLLRCEERQGKITQYDLLREAQIRMPKQFSNPREIDCLCIVKLPQKERSYERAFFFASSAREFQDNWDRLVEKEVITSNATPLIEEYIVGVQVNLNFFYSPLDKRLELLGTDTRRQTNISGLIALPARDQLVLPSDFPLFFEEAGHAAVTILESMIGDAFELAQRFVTATQQLMSPGIIGPFSLQASIVPGKKKKEFVVFDVSPRVPGSPGIAATPYMNYLYGRPINVGERIAMEVKKAMNENAMNQITT